MRKISFAALIATASLFASSARATVYLDFEEDPLPLVEVSVVIPAGFEAKDAKEVGAANVLPDILDAGSKKMNRSAFNDKLGNFGANFDFSVSNRYSQWDLSFPVVEGKNYDELATVLAENWQTPRFDNATFKLAKLKLDSSIKGSLDSDFSLAIGTIRRWLNKGQFQGHPVFVENLARLQLPTVKKVYERDFQKAKDVWVGVVAPKSSLDAIKKIVSSVFKAQGEVVVGEHLKELPVPMPPVDKVKVTKQVLILDKADRTQTVTALIGVYPGQLPQSDELGFFMGNHIFFDAGLGSIFGEEIRTKRGLAYSVGSAGKFYLDMPTISVAMNPLREKTGEALAVTADLTKKAFATGELVTALPDAAWNRYFKSFQYGKVLGSATPSARLAQRMEVVTGVMSADFYKSRPEDWKIDRAGVKKVISGLWNKSPVVLALVGSAKELKPLAEKSFPGYQVKVIPYKEAIHEKTYNGI